MEQGFTKGNSANLPRVDLLMLGDFLASNKDFCSAEFRNVKTSVSSRPSYGDDAVSYVQVKHEANICIVKAKICPEHRVHAKLYEVTLIVDEQKEEIQSVQCHDCVASRGGCKHAIAFLMWVHRRSEEPSSTSVECYWKKSKLSRVGTTLKYITCKEFSNGKPCLPSNRVVLEKFLEEGKKRKLNDCELIKYQDYFSDNIDQLSMHNLVLKNKETSCDTFLQKVSLTDADVRKVEEETRAQSESKIWHELRYGRITASRVYEFSRCKTTDGSLISLIMGGKIPDTPAMKRGRMLEDHVRETVSSRLGKEIKKCGLILSKKYPMIAGSPDGLCEDGIVEIKCPVSAKSYDKYVHNGKPTQKFYAQIQLQMYLTERKTGYFCVADSNFNLNKKVNIIMVPYNENYVSDLIQVVVSLWKQNIYPLVHQGACQVVNKIFNLFSD